MIVEVVFNDNIFHPYDAKRYDYRTDLEVKEGDPVVVEVDGRLKVVTVMGIKESSNYPGTLKWIVDKVDIQTYLKRAL